MVIQNEETIKKIDQTIEEKNITLGADLKTEEETDLHLWILIQSKRKAIDKDQIQPIGIKKVRIIIYNNKPQ